MASLKEATSRTVEDLGMHRVEPIPAPHAGPPPVIITPPRFTRCPVPPLSISPDTLDDSKFSNKSPQHRFLALPPLFENTKTGGNSNTTTSSTTVNGVTTVVTTTTASNGKTSTTTASSPAVSFAQSNSLTASSSALSLLNNRVTNTAIVTPPISQGNPYTTSIQMSTVFALYKVVVGSPARVELYSTDAFQNADLGRASTTPVTLGSENGIIADFSLALPSESIWICSPAPLGFNGDDPISSVIYITVTNLNTSTAPITVNLFYLPLEGN